MKYFSPSYWFKLWLLSAQLFSDQTKNTNAMLIDKNKNIKNWTSLSSHSLQSNFTNSAIENITNNQFMTNQDRNLEQLNQTILDIPRWDQNLTTIRNKNEKEKSKKRIKRKDEDKKIAYVPDLEISYIEKNYYSNILRIISTLNNHGILDQIFDSDNNPDPDNIVPNAIYQSNNNEYDYFVIPIHYDELGNDVRLVFRTDNLYLEGFIVTYHRGGHLPDTNIYYHFSDARLINFPGIEEYTSVALRFSGHYSNLWTQRLRTRNITWADIVYSFNNLRVYNPNIDDEIIENDLALVILTTAEALRFRAIFQLIVNTINDRTLIHWNFVQPIVNDWNRRSQEIFEILVSISNIRQNAKLLRSLGIAIVLGYFIKMANNCPDKVTIKNFKNDLENKYWDEQFCNLETQINKMQGEIKIIKILDKHTQSDNLKAGTIYVGTTNGVYFISIAGNVFKFDGLNFPITSIKLDRNGSAYVTNNQEEVYHLDLVGLGSKKLEKIESNKIDEELKLYYRNKKENEVLHLSPTNSIIRKSKIYNLGLERINPVDNYKKLKFLGDIINNRLKWGNSPSNCWDFTSDYKIGDCYFQDVIGKNLNKYLQDKNNHFHNIIKNIKVSSDISADEICKQYTPQVLDDIDETYGGAHVYGSHSFGLTWYWENNNYFLQTLFCLYADWRASESSLDSYFKIGQGIKLYNDDVQDVEAVNENTDSWKNNEIINVINNEETTENITSTANIKPSNNFDINDINSIINYQNQSVANVSSTNITTI